MIGFGLVLNMGSFRMPVKIKPTTISGTMNLLLDKRAHERGPYTLMNRFIKIILIWVTYSIFIVEYTALMYNTVLMRCLLIYHYMDSQSNNLFIYTIFIIRKLYQFNKNK